MMTVVSETIADPVASPTIDKRIGMKIGSGKVCMNRCNGYEYYKKTYNSEIILNFFFFF